VLNFLHPYVSRAVSCLLVQAFDLALSCSDMCTVACFHRFPLLPNPLSTSPSRPLAFSKWCRLCYLCAPPIKSCPSIHVMRIVHFLCYISFLRNQSPFYPYARTWVHVIPQILHHETVCCSVYYCPLRFSLFTKRVHSLSLTISPCKLVV